MSFRHLREGRWLDAEHELTALLARPGAGDQARDLSMLGVAQARLLGRVDVRGALPMLLSVASQERRLTPGAACRFHVVSSFLFSTPEPGVADGARSLAHVRAARCALSAHPDPDLHGLAVVAELHSRLLGGDADEFLAAAEEWRAELEAPGSPVKRCLALEMGATALLAAGHWAREGDALEEALDAARRADFAASESRLLARMARRAVETGQRTVATAHLEAAVRALSRAGADATWVHRAISECRRAIDAGRAPASFVFAATGLEKLPGSSDGAPIRHAPTAPPGLELELSRLGPSRATVLLTGGLAERRRAVARSLHERGGRPERPFVGVDCASMDVDALELALFGGPIYDHEGRGAVHAPASSTLHVSAIDALPLLMQPRFLRFLDSGPRPRVIASSGLDLRELMAKGALRGDLGERLLLVEVRLPAET